MKERFRGQKHDVERTQRGNRKFYQKLEAAKKKSMRGPNKIVMRV
jgi:hypothetical protein